MSDRQSKCPTYVAGLAYGGLLPFIALAILQGADSARASWWLAALVGYGAVILSFVGALHWGIAMTALTLDARQRRVAFGWSVLPALIAWGAIVLSGRGAALMLLSGFVLHWIQDIRLSGPAGLPAWYLPLRVRLTAVACMCLLWAAVG
jgi:hypothetical protein